jgi:hypothetical protein
LSRGSSNVLISETLRPLPALTTFCAHMMLMTVLSILAVDFPVFPCFLAKCENSLSHTQSRKSRGEPGASTCRHILAHFSRACITWVVWKQSLKVQTDSSRSTYYLGSLTYNFDLRLCKVRTACEATSALLAFHTFQSCYLSSASYASIKKILLRLK